jgi:hypothetical protein
VTAITPGSVRRGRLYHVQFKPLYEAIGEPDNRHRKPAALGRQIERLMVLDAVLADSRYYWLGTERDKVHYFDTALNSQPRKETYPQVTYGAGRDAVRRFFPHKLPIGVEKDGFRRHVFLYLVTGALPWQFRQFLLDHAQTLMAAMDAPTAHAAPPHDRQGRVPGRLPRPVHASRRAVLRDLVGGVFCRVPTDGTTPVGT